MLIRVLIFSSLVLAVNLVAGIFAKDQINQDLSPKNQRDFYIRGQIYKYNPYIYIRDAFNCNLMFCRN
jgi:hypothetical protein